MLTVLSVSEFLSQINGIIAGEFVVEGEISQYKISQGKWIFFDLKDDKSTVNCFSTVYTIKAPLEDGMKIRVVGYPKIHEKSGRFSLTVQHVELVGEGSLKKAYLLLKEKLNKEGLFAVERKRPLPKMPSRIGVVASRDSAAWGDFWRILNNRWQGVEIHLYHVQVQGESAVDEVVRAFEYFNQNDTGCETIVLIRGGGSLEDLAAFNTEEVVRAIYGSRLPVVCGVGHERDETLADFAADVRASTPSNAAEIVVPDKHAFLSELEMTMDHIAGRLKNQLVQTRRDVEQKFYVISGKFEAPFSRSRMLLERFVATRMRIVSQFEYLKNSIFSYGRLLENINPKRLLQQGYSITRDGAGKIIRSKTAVDSGARIMVEFSDGKIDAQVTENNTEYKQDSLLFIPYDRRKKV